MKKIVILTALIIFLMSSYVSSQCLPDGITFTTQSQINDFPSNYPDCTEILGDITIEGWNITNLDSLYTITAFKGNLTIKYTSLLDLVGLGNVKKIDGFFRLENSGGIFFFTGLSKLFEIGGDFILLGDENNNGPFFDDFRGLDSLSKIGGDLIIDYGRLYSFYGLENLDSIHGSFIISHLNQIWSLEYLSNLQYIGGDIDISWIDQLFNLNGLENIDPNSIDNITICNNPQLSNCAIESICNYLSNPSGVITIYDNASGCNSPPEIANDCGISLSCLPYGDYYFFDQVEIDSFKINYDNCTEIYGSIIIEGFNNITDLYGFDEITGIGGSLNVLNNNKLESLSGLNNITSIGGNIILQTNALLGSLYGLENIDSIYGDLSIRYNDTLENLTVLSNLKYIGGTLNISGNAMLMNLNGLGNVDFIGGLYIRNTEALLSISNLENITSIDGDIYIGYNNALLDFSGLQNLETVNGDVWINDNWPLQNFYGFNKLSSIEGDLQIRDSQAFSNMTGLEQLTSVGGLLDICFNQSLLNMQGLESLDSVGSLSIHHNSGLKNLHGLESLFKINSYLSLKFNYNLDSLTGLEGVTSIGGILRILDHPSLKSMTGIENIEAGTIGDLTISGNDSLSHCSVTSICNYLAAPNGEIEIADNAQGCNSQSEVEYYCLVGTFPILEKDSHILIYPNPTIRELNFSSFDLLIHKINIYNQFGQIVLSKLKTKKNIDVSSLSSGIYIIEFITDRRIFIEKFIIE